MKISTYEWIIEKFEEYPFHARTTRQLRPENVPGIHFSSGDGPGVRKWGFQTEVERDRFIKEYDAEKC